MDREPADPLGAPLRRGGGVSGGTKGARMTERAGLVLRIERTFDASAEELFDAWTSTEVLKRWLHADPHWETPTAEVDLRVGGALRIVMRDPMAGEDHGASGEYTVIDPPRRLAFT